MSKTIFAQSVFEKYESNENVTSFIAGKKSFAMLANAKLNSENEKIQKGKEILSGVESIEVYSTEDQLVALDMKTSVAAYAESSGLDELIQIKNSGSSISIMVKQGASESIVTQVLVFVGNHKNLESENREPPDHIQRRVNRQSSLTQDQTRR